MPAPAVSICLPVFNGERHLAAAIESALCQSLPDFELLIADDASSDSSWEIIAGFAGRDRRITAWRNEQNIGLFQNYNECMKRAAGRYIKPFAQDDRLAPPAIEHMALVLDSNPNIALTSSARRWIDQDGKPVSEIRTFPANQLISGGEVIRYNMLKLTNWVGEPSAVMFRSQAAGRGFDPAYYHYGDIEYWFRILESGDYFYINEVLCEFRRHALSATSKNLSGLLFALDLFRLGRSYRDTLSAIGESEEHFHCRAVETIALNVDHLVRTEGLTLESVQRAAQARTGAEGTSDSGQIEGFRELSFHALRYITRLLAEHDDLKCRSEAEIAHLKATLANLENSTSWKMTAPLRNIGRVMRT